MRENWAEQVQHQHSWHMDRMGHQPQSSQCCVGARRWQYWTATHYDEVLLDRMIAERRTNRRLQ